jgi:3-methyladenine DNA glycosylase Mpg
MHSTMKRPTQLNRVQNSIRQTALLAVLCVPVAGLLAAKAAVPIVPDAYLKASNTDPDDNSGFSAAISGDTLVVGAPGEDSIAIGVNGDQSNNAGGSGAAYVFIRDGNHWVQQAYLKPSRIRPGFGAFFGDSVAIDGDTIIVGASDDFGTGTAYVFVRSGTNWQQQAALKASNPAPDQFGAAVAIYGDTIVVGAPEESSNATGVNGNQNNDLAFNSGAAYVFVRNGTNWTQQAYLKASNTGASDFFGASVSVSGETIVIGAFAEDSNAAGVNGNQSNNSALFAGAAYVFVRSGTNWSQQAYLKASNPGAEDRFGCAVSVSGDTIVVGAQLEGSNAVGVNGDQSNNSAPNSGAAYVFVRGGTTWTQQAYLKASNTQGGAGLFNGDRFGWSAAIAQDTIVIGAWNEDSNATGVDGVQSNNSATNSGAAYVFTRTGTNWSQRAYLKASNTGVEDLFGSSVALSDHTIVVGAFQEDSSATGVNGDQTNNNAMFAGAAYTYEMRPPFLELQASQVGASLHLTATGTTNTNWRLEFRDILGGTNGWQPLTNIHLGPEPVSVPFPLDRPYRFYRGVWVP